MVYPKKKKGSSQRGSGNSAPSHLNDSPFAISIPQTPEMSTPKGQFSFKEDSDNNKNTAFNNENKSADNKKSASYTKTEAVEMVSGILTEFFSTPEYAGKIKNMSDAVKMAMSTLSGAGAYDATYVRK